MNLNISLEIENRREKSEFPFFAYWMPDYGENTPLVPPHWHREMEILWSEDTAGILYINDRSYEIKPGDVFFINPGCIHRTFRKTHGFMSHVVFDPSILITGSSGRNPVNQILADLARERVGLLEAPEGEFLEALRPLLRDLVTHGEHTVEIGAESCRVTAILFSVLAECFRFEAFRREGDENLYGLRYITQMMEMIRDRFAEPINAESLAASAGISQTYVYKLFRDYVGSSPVNYINAVRLRESYRLLEDGHNVTEAAVSCGIPNTSYYIKLFKEATGMTPYQWLRTRKEHL
ncbi:MAG: helix-turn-helix transcriptional regulator [Clostridia bacterium]|nr:helix-turn-helix transcriptional regulator [Clostridia bacterium]MBR5365812.1 helix-turn-helix transcriptional regulator [Clostridia bacterium]